MLKKKLMFLLTWNPVLILIYNVDIQVLNVMLGM